MALLIAPATSTAEISFTVRASLSARGKSARRSPSAKVRKIAHSAAAPPRNQNGFTGATLPNGRGWTCHGANACRWERHCLAMLAATRRTRAVGTRVRPLTAAAGSLLAGDFRRALNGAPHDPQETRDGDLEDEHHPDEGPSQGEGMVPGKLSLEQAS